MKKVFAMAALVIGLAACSESKTEEKSSTTDSTGQNTTTESAAGDRSQEISDSTRMLDKQLADSNSTMSPDSLK